MSKADDVKKLRELIKDIRFAMLTTIEDDGTLRSRPMGTQQAEGEADLWFFTYGGAAKADEVRRDDRVNVSFADNDGQKWVSVSGRAAVVRDRAKMEELWNPVLKAWFPKGLEEPDIALLKVEVEQAEYWDTASSKMVQLAGFVKAVATGKPADPGENVKLDLTTA
jgi:general stress protein 26